MRDIASDADARSAGRQNPARGGPPAATTGRAWSEMRPHQRPPTRPRRRVEKKKRKASRPVSRVPPPPPPPPPRGPAPPTRGGPPPPPDGASRIVRSAQPRVAAPSKRYVTRRICSWAAYGTRRSVAAASPARSRATGHTRLSRGISPGLPTRADTVQGGGVGAAAPARLRFAAHGYWLQ
jgi:hypothetical protein